jgi:uncharacterized protein with GYD domain
VAVVTFAVLVNWIDAWHPAPEEVADRVESIKLLVENAGGKVKSHFLTLGPHDAVMIVDLPEADESYRMLSSIGSAAGVRTTVLCSYDASQIAETPLTVVEDEPAGV